MRKIATHLRLHCCVCDKPATFEVYSSNMQEAGQKPRKVCDDHTHEDAEWALGGHPYLCPCGRCDGTGDPIGKVPVLGSFRVEPDGSLTEIEDKDRS